MLEPQKLITTISSLGLFSSKYYPLLHTLKWIKLQNLSHMCHKPKLTTVLKQTYSVLKHNLEFHQQQLYKCVEVIKN